MRMVRMCMFIGDYTVLRTLTGHINSTPGRCFDQFQPSCPELGIKLKRLLYRHVVLSGSMAHLVSGVIDSALKQWLFMRQWEHYLRACKRRICYVCWILEVLISIPDYIKTYLFPMMAFSHCPPPTSIKTGFSVVHTTLEPDPGSVSNWPSL